MMTCNAIQFPGFLESPEFVRPSVVSVPGEEASRTFRQAYERPAELPHTVELPRTVRPQPMVSRPPELPPATPETLAKVVTENLAVAKELPQPIELPQPVELSQAVERPQSVERPQAVVEPQVVVSRPPELPPATPETLAKVVTENLAVAKDLPQPIEIPQSVELPLSAEQPRTVVPQEMARPTELPPATPETLAKVVTENLTLATELPKPIELPRMVEIPQAAEQPRTVVPQEVARPTELPPATPETLAKVVTENLTLATELPKPVELPRMVEIPQAVEQPRTVVPQEMARPTELPPATPETLAKVVTENLTLAKELPQSASIAAGSSNQPYHVDGSTSERCDLGQGALLRPLQSPRLSRTSDDQTVEPSPELQALPVAMPSLQPVASVEEPQGAPPVAGVAAKVSAEGPRTASAIVWEAASAVADALLVTPSLMRGEGEVVVQLKPDVLDGSRLRIQVTGKAMLVAFEPVTDDVARLLTETQPQLVRHLTERMPAFEFAVTVQAANMTARRGARKSVGRGEA